MAIGDYLDIIALGVNSVFAFAFYRAYKSISNEADLIEKAPTYKIGKELNDAINEAPNKCLPYATITGNVKALGRPITGIYSNVQGVISSNEIIERKAVRSSIGWQNLSNSLQSFTNECRFVIVNPEMQSSKPTDCVEVTNPLKSDYLLGSLPIMYSCYEPLQSSVLSRSLDLWFGNLVQGHHLVEQILEEDSTLLAVGRIYTATSPVSGIVTKIKDCLNPGLMIGPPLDTKYPFVLSLANKSQVVESIRGRSQVFRYTSYAFGAIGVGLIVYVIYRTYKKWKLVRADDKSISEIGVNPSSSIAEAAWNESPCVVCLTAAKSLLLMPCRHLCVCSACYEALPTPKNCPICRTAVNQRISVFFS